MIVAVSAKSMKGVLSSDVCGDGNEAEFSGRSNTHTQIVY